MAFYSTIFLVPISLFTCLILLNMAYLTVGAVWEHRMPTPVASQNLILSVDQKHLLAIPHSNRDILDQLLSGNRNTRISN